MIVLAIALILVSVAVPSVNGLMRTYRRDAAIQQIAGDVRKARAEAIRTGWQCRIVGFNTGATSPYKNQYRMMGRSSGAVAWPADTVAPFQSATQTAGAWVDIAAMYRGVRLNPGDVTADFAVAFDSRGVRIELDPSFDPLSVAGEAGSTRTVSISAVGSVRVE